MIHRAREAGVRPDDVADITYAICALADELALGVPGAMQQYWMYNLLQLRYFNENVAGENFFHRLQALRADPELPIPQSFPFATAKAFCLPRLRETR